MFYPGAVSFVFLSPICRLFLALVFLYYKFLEPGPTLSSRVVPGDGHYSVLFSDAFTESLAGAVQFLLNLFEFLVIST